MGFSTNRIVTLWSWKDEGKYATANISSNERDKDTKELKRDFGEGYVRFIGKAYNRLKQITMPVKGGVMIFLDNADCKNNTVEKDGKKKTYYNFLVYDFHEVIWSPDDKKWIAKGADIVSQKQQTYEYGKVIANKTVPEDEDDDDDLPF